MIKYNQVKEISKEYITAKLNEYLEEDSPNGDITTEGTVNPKSKIVAQLIAKDNLVLAGRNVVEAMFGSETNVTFNFSDGDTVANRDLIATIEGNAIEILRKERIFLNLMQRMCGIATTTKAYVEIAKPNNVIVLDTRKTTPGLRMFEKYSVCMGGGQNHRYNLSTGILIKDNHIVAAGGVREAVLGCKKLDSTLPVQIEVDSKEQIPNAIESGADGLLLDNMTPDYLSECVKFARELRNDIFLEASGGITLQNLAGYVTTGIDAVSVGALTHSVKSSDISLKFI
ncbi:MAG: nicotinate-nucleotide diphosphorylase (carboxylating) [Ignavibacteriae bacterium HGW-Ignavibacteriae-4]|jgi:nicotinate-nucleotide pyrophosphorylase (carboxylating)|nr:MAG: nicotinate-nucleotide diphosphorylase (carboxylating) [Ignavibacteriae bacterium HGW-Ignavibacteriae-4]